MSQDKMAESGNLPFLLEIGSEEIPARFIPGAMSELQARTEKLLEQAHLSWEGLRVLATPRRLSLVIEALQTRQPDRGVQIKGPPVSVAYDGQGQPTPAGLGFARKAGVELDACRVQEGARGSFLVVDKTEPGRDTSVLLADELPGLILSLPFRKVMRWGNLDLEYPRPLQWLVALLGDEIVPMRLDYLTAGRVTRGHRTLAEDRAVELTGAGQYEQALLAEGVVVDPKQRRKLILAGLARSLADFHADAVVLEDEELLTEVVFLCEHPTPFLGTYSEDFFALPDRVITTALKSHQRYFSVGRRQGGRLLPRFAAVRDGGTAHLEKVVAGNERVLRARLADALFYWEFDQRQSPDERTNLLEAVTWLEGFGSVRDKIKRLGQLVVMLWEGGLGAEGDPPADLFRAAEICKSDLVSEMIKDGKEFTKLEGFIGASYARLSGENEAVCQAVERHYWPRSAEDELPGERISSILAIADRLDTVAGCWLAGFQPTGTRDPYALRRHVIAVIRILLAREARLDLRQAFARALAPFADHAGGSDLEAAGREIGTFVRTRLAGYFMENLACHPAAVRAVLPVRWQDPVDAGNWINALTGFRSQEDFMLLATGFKRCRNILKEKILDPQQYDACFARWQTGGRGAGGESFAGLLEEAEKDLLGQVAGAADFLARSESAGDYAEVFGRLAGLGPAIDRFFDSVRVNVEDQELRTIRQVFLGEIHGLFARYADFSEVAPVEE